MIPANIGRGWAASLGSGGAGSECPRGPFWGRRRQNRAILAESSRRFARPVSEKPLRQGEARLHLRLSGDVHSSGGAVMRLSLVPQERRFYAPFKKQGELVNESLEQLRNGLLEGQTRHPRLRELEHECDDVTHEIYNLINHTSVTPFEREDIYSLASSLDEVVDLAEEVSDKIDLYRVKEITPSARRMGELLAKAGKELELAVAGLEGFKNLGPHRLAIHSLENEGDRITREALAQLFTDGASPTDLVKRKDLYDLLETTMDQCEHVANVLEATSIKNA